MVEWAGKLGLSLLVLGPAAAVSLWLQPWRAWGSPPAWPAWLLCVLMPGMWSLDVISGQPLLQPLSLACLLVLLVGWPLGVLAFAAVGLVMVWAPGLALLDAVHRVTWQGVVPATLLLLLGAGIRRWLPQHLFVYILGRGFLATGVSLMLAGGLEAVLFGAPLSVSTSDVMLARGLSAFGEAFLTGMCVAIFVAFRPHWLATYADRLYLPRP